MRAATPRHRARSIPIKGFERQIRIAHIIMEVDLRGHEVRVRGSPVTLTVREFELLAFLMLHPGRVFRRDELLEHVWGYRFGDTSTVTVHEIGRAHV